MKLCLCVHTCSLCVPVCASCLHMCLCPCVCTFVCLCVPVLAGMALCFVCPCVCTCVGLCPCGQACTSGTVAAHGGLTCLLGQHMVLEASAGWASGAVVTCPRASQVPSGCAAGSSMECLFPTPPGELYSSDLQDGFVSPNHSLLPPDLLLNVSHGAFLPLGLKVTIVGLYLAVCVGGLLGNCLVMYVILR